MRSMYSGVSGLRLHQIKMDVIGNNIANVNTIGFKRGQVSFQEAFSQVMKSAGSPEQGKGGTNPQQVGLGLALGAINTIHTKGATQRTDNPTDLMIDGEGYFMVSDDEDTENICYTRAGNFGFDIEGNMVTPDGYKLVGKFLGGSDYAKFLGVDPAKDLDSIKINKSVPSPPSASAKVDIRGNLDSRETSYTTDVYIKDSLGNSYKVDLKFDKSAANEWTVTPAVKNVATNEAVTGFTLTAGNIEFDSSGNLDISGGGIDQFSIDFNGASLGGNPLTTNFGKGSAAGDNVINFDLSKLTQFSNENDAKGFDVEDADGQIGRASGSLTDFAIDPTGTLIASFSNGVKKSLWQLKVAKFDNPMGLVKTGGNLFSNSPNSGEPQIGNAGSSGLGSINAGTLEMSNVDLSMEFTDMIATQRGFQANSRIITATDEMLQELTNMKR